MYEETKSSIDWKGIFLKVIIAFLIVLIAVKGYSTFKNSDKDTKITSDTISESKNSSTFLANKEKLREAGEKYFTNNKDKIPAEEGTTSMITLNELIEKGMINTLADEDGKNCDGDSSYVTAFLEGEKVKIKANLVCGDTSSVATVYLGENDVKEKEQITITDNKDYNKNNKTNNNNNTNSGNNCGKTCLTPVVHVDANAEATSNTNINYKTDSSSNESNSKVPNKPSKYIVRFDSNGGSREYAPKEVEAYDTVKNPGATNISGYKFKGWYLNGEKYDFSTPVTKNITLIAKFKEIDFDDEDIEIDLESDLDYSRYSRYTKSVAVHTMGWDVYGTDYIKISHTLQIPEFIKNAKNVTKVRIKSITYGGPIDDTNDATKFYANHPSTFLYTKSEYDSRVNMDGIFSTINGNAVKFYPSGGTATDGTEYKTYKDALNNGFDVTWVANDVYKQCDRTFSVNGVDNLCDYGIYYFVNWEYITQYR